jgi:3-oxoacyl-(acyl-carrier-protein) synthase/acyl carrier protein
MDMEDIYKLIIENVNTEKINKQAALQLLKMLKKKELQATDDIAIIGVAVRMPGLDALDAYWETICNGIDCVVDFPEPRKKGVEAYIRERDQIRSEERINYTKGAFLENIDEFDYKFFRLSPKEASLMDPSQRLFLQTAWQAVEDAGYGGKKLMGSKTGVYVGYSFQTGYQEMIYNDDPSLMAYSKVGNIPPMLPARIAYLLDLRGPSMIMDAACSSSTVAVHLACQALKHGDCDMALVGGLRIHFFPVDNDYLKLGVEASDGRTRSFDEHADGQGTGEGVGAVILKPLRLAKRDGDNIYAMIKGSAVNQNGASIGITAPNSVAQEQVIIQAWKNARIDPASISYIEAHGTATNLGDPLEIKGLSNAFKKYTSQKQFCAVNTVKSNIGNLYECAGIAGFVKAVLALKHQKIPPAVHFNKPNKKIDFMNSPCYVNNRIREWERGAQPRRCGVSTFGLSGTNCHIVLEEYLPQTEKSTDRKGTSHILSLSAKSKDALKNLVQDYVKFLNGGASADIQDICYTANTGRGHYNVRLVILAASREELLDKLKKIHGVGVKEIREEWAFYGEHRIIAANKKNKGKNEITEGEKKDLQKDAKRCVEQYVKSGKKDRGLLAKLSSLYVRGAEIDWEDLYPEEGCQRISLPVYPFERYVCWFKADTVSGAQKQPGKNHSYFSIYLKQEELESAHKTEYKDAVRIRGRGRGSEHYTSTERMVAQIWGKILGYEEIDVEDDYYDLGGDSVLSIQIAKEISKEIQSYLNPVDLLRFLTVSEISKYIDEKYASGREKGQVKYPPFQSTEEREVYPTSYTQKMMYMIERLGGAGTAYNVFRVELLEGQLGVEKIENALRALIDRHEVLKTSIEFIGGEVVQRVHKYVDFKVTYMEADEDSLQDVIEHFKRPFDLGRPPLIRVAVVKLQEDKYALLHDIHHIVTDGLSSEILQEELLLLYKGIQLPEQRLQYKDFAVWQNQLMQTDLMKAQGKYWLNIFNGKIPVLNIPTDYPRPEVLKYHGNIVATSTDKILAAKLKTLSVKKGASLYMVLLAAYNLLLAKYTAQEDIVIGSPVLGRPVPELEKMVGIFVNTLPMRNYPSGIKTFGDFLIEVKNHVLEAFQNQDYPIVELTNRLNISRSLNRHPLFDTVFALQNVPSNKEKQFISNVKGRSLSEVWNLSDYDLEMQVIPLVDTLKINLEYCTRLFTKETAERMLKDYVNILETVTAKPDVRIEEIELQSSRDHVYIYGEDEEVLFNL